MALQIGIELDIDNFRRRFVTGARSYLFYMQPIFPTGASAIYVTISRQATPIYLVRATSLPSSNFDELTASWQGFDYKAAGKRSYDTWNVTFTVDQYAGIRQAFVEWQDKILDPRTNRHGVPGDGGGYMADQLVSLINFDFNSEAITYKLVGAYPSTVGEVTLDYADSAYATFDVTFTYQYFITATGGQIPGTGYGLPSVM